MTLESAGLHIFPWDFADEGVDQVMDFVLGLGITRLSLASAYHAGFFLQPHNPRRKVRLVEDGVAYFHPTTSRYTDSLIKPQVASMCAETDWFGSICERATSAGMQVTAWTVRLHNTRVGLLHPELTIQNAFGDSYPHALTPGHPAVKAYLRALVADLADKYPLYSVLLEAPDYRIRSHGGDWVSGHHHERDGVHLRPLERDLMDLSFNAADVSEAQRQGIDVETVRRAVRDHLERYFAVVPSTPAGLPETIEQFRSQLPALVDLEGYYRRAEEALLVELREEAEPRGVRLEGVGSSAALDVRRVGVYGEPAGRVAGLLTEAAASLLPHQELVASLRVGFNSPGMGSPIISQEQTREMTRVVADSGADGISYYNYSEAPRRSIEWIGPALQSVGFEGLVKGT